MKTQELIDRTREYLDYIENHVKNVQKAWKELQRKCSDMDFMTDETIKALIDTDVQQHDLSKLSESEFVQYRKCFYPCSDEGKYDLGEAWMHHKLCNSHHHENWTLNAVENSTTWKVNCVHMIIDWMAMGYKFNSPPREYYEKNKDMIVLPDFAIEFMYKIFDRIGK